MKSSHKAAIASALCAGLFSTLNPALAMADPTNTNGDLHWALRDSFIRYVGGATNVTNGATKEQKSGDKFESRYNFKQVSANYEAKNNTTRAQFQGTVEYFEYCDGQPKKQGNCALELTISDPAIVIDDDGGRVEAKVRSKQYPGGSIYEADKAVIADLDVANAHFEVKDGRSYWSELVPTIANDGVKTFSNFYDIGSPLAPIDFSFKGDSKRPNITPAPMRLLGSYPSKVDAESNNRLFTTGEYGVLTAKNRLEVFNLGTMSQLAELDINADANVLTAVGRQNEVLWVDGTTLKRANISNKGLSEPEAVAVVPEKAIALTASSDGTAYVIARGERESATLSTVNVGGAVTTVELTNPREVETSVSQVKAESTELNGFYGELTALNLKDFAVLKDGKLLYSPNTTVNGNDGATVTVPPMLITTDGKVTAALQQSALDKTGNEFLRPTAFVTNGERVAVYNTGWRGFSALQFFKYENGQLVPTSDRKPIEGKWDIAGVSFLKDGTAMVATASDGSLNWVNSQTVAVEHSIKLRNSNGTKTDKHRTMLTTPTGDVLANSVVTDATNYKEYSDILRISDPKKLAEKNGVNEDRLPPKREKDSDTHVQGDAPATDDSAAEPKAPGQNDDTKQPAPVSEPKEQKNPGSSDPAPTSSQSEKKPDWKSSLSFIFHFVTTVASALFKLFTMLVPALAHLFRT